MKEYRMGVLQLLKEYHRIELESGNHPEVQKVKELIGYCRFLINFNPALFRGRKGLRELKDILLDYQKELKKRI